ncbi:MAG: hypothetical protein HY556_08495 [Euryarchaeota archaeon]|nr:hypothetical protein [Euryarchaeota archaeon]
MGATGTFVGPDGVRTSFVNSNLSSDVDHTWAFGFELILEGAQVQFRTSENGFSSSAYSDGARNPNVFKFRLLEPTEIDRVRLNSTGDIGTAMVETVQGLVWLDGDLKVATDYAFLSTFSTISTWGAKDGWSLRDQPVSGDLYVEGRGTGWINASKVTLDVAAVQVGGDTLPSFEISAELLLVNATSPLVLQGCSVNTFWVTLRETSGAGGQTVELRGPAVPEQVTMSLGPWYNESLALSRSPEPVIDAGSAVSKYGLAYVRLEPSQERYGVFQVFHRFHPGNYSFNFTVHPRLGAEFDFRLPFQSTEGTCEWN